MLRYIVGEGFNARDETEGLILKLAVPIRPTAPLCALIDMQMSLTQSSSIGFHEIRHKWRAGSLGQLFVYEDAGVIGVISVPGDGRTDTRDLTLLGVGYYEIGLSESDEVSYLTEMLRRKRDGLDHEWDQS